MSEGFLTHDESPQGPEVDYDLVNLATDIIELVGQFEKEHGRTLSEFGARGVRRKYLTLIRERCNEAIKRAMGS